MGEKQTQPFQLSFKSTLTVDLADRLECSRGESSFRCKKLAGISWSSPCITPWQTCVTDALCSRFQDQDGNSGFRCQKLASISWVRRRSHDRPPSWACFRHCSWMNSTHSRPRETVAKIV
jgi:hypothetical protein